MAKPHKLHLFDWNRMIDSFHKESDRGAAVLVGGFVENYLGVYLQSLVVDAKVADDLFQAVGPLSSFSQRIAVARAFGFISKNDYDDLNLIRRIRNHFAHHPLEASFSESPVVQLATHLSEQETASESHSKNTAERNKLAYLYSCAQVCGRLHLRMEKREKAAKETKQ
ncbi:MAG: MltR family transcriptional regulator [Pseudomonadota bacterium]